MKNKTTEGSNSNQGQTAQQDREIQLLKDLLDRVSAHAEELEKELSGTSREIDSLRKSSEYWENEAAQLRLALDDLYNSRSWKITLPVRLFSRLMRRICSLPFRIFTQRGHSPDPREGEKTESKGSPRSRAGTIELSPGEIEIYQELRQVINKKRTETDADRN